MLIFDDNVQNHDYADYAKARDLNGSNGSIWRLL
jgi:hypothetical protein